MPLLVPPVSAQPVPGEKRRLVVIAVVIGLVLAGVAGWAMARPGAYGQSRAGCVTVTVPSTTGGAILHQCGARARTWCHSVSGRDDRLSRLIQRECRAAGLD
jgi:hypothetical protein